jgi:diphthine-ammonia ligase
MKFVALVSGGKDSIYSIIECIRNGHELVGCVHLGAPLQQQQQQHQELTSDGGEEESYMYQTAASEVMTTLVEECLGVPFILYPRVGRSIHTGLVYEGGQGQQQGQQQHHHDTTPATNKQEEEDEVEDLYHALQVAQERLVDTTPFQAVSSGAIFSTYQRVRIENVCSRLGLTSLSYLWRCAPQHELLPQMMQNNDIVAVLVRTACPPGLQPRKHLNQTLQSLTSSTNGSGSGGLFQRLNQLYQFQVCGEGGEYESLVLDSSIYKKRLVLDEVEIVVEPDTDEGIGNLRILKWHAEDKVGGVSSLSEDAMKGMAVAGATTTNTMSDSKTVPQQQPQQQAPAPTPAPLHIVTPLTITTENIVYMPQLQRGTGGLWHVSGILAPIPGHCCRTPNNTATATTTCNNINNNDLHHHHQQQEVQYAVQEAIEIFDLLHHVLHSNGCTAQDVVMVHLYLSEMSHFATINTHYRTFFGTVLPPSRSCVAVGSSVLPGGRRVQLDCVVQSGSGRYMRTKEIRQGTNENENDTNGNHDNETGRSSYTRAAQACSTSTLRQVLHVQSISHWAPVCVGPYSQVNTIRSGLHFLAGQIGLNPSTMTIVEGGWMVQLQTCWKNIASVLDALDGGGGGGCLDHLVSGLVYVADHIYSSQPGIVRHIEQICRDQIRRNAGIIPGRIDATQPPPNDMSTTALYGGYEDEETWLAEQDNEKNNDHEDQEPHQSPQASCCPLLVVSIPEMPVGAIVEVEVIAATAKAASSLTLNDTWLSCQKRCTTQPNEKHDTPSLLGWDSGHDFPATFQQQVDNSTVQIDGTMRCLGKGCAAAVIVTASRPHNTTSPTSSDMASERAGTSSNCLQIDPDALLRDMLTTVDKVLAQGRSGLDTALALHVRLYHVATERSLSSNGTTSVVVKDDGTRLRSSLQSALASWRNRESLCPATTVVPVQAMTLIPSLRSTADANDDEGVMTFLAMQVLVVDPVHLETELWIHRGREYF